jgi:multiple antibiotic resistance protein
MPARDFIDCTLLLFVLLNPFLLSIYLLDLIQQLEGKTFRGALLQGAAISAAAFSAFALAGDAIFSRVLQIRFGSFLIFGGLMFLVIAVRFFMEGSKAISELRGSPEHVAGSIALPFMIGPGTVSASVLAGSRLPFGWAVLSIVAALLTTTVCVLALKWLYDSVKDRYESYVERYIDVVGRISALVVGSIAIEMILKGLDLWLDRPTS